MPEHKFKAHEPTTTSYRARVEDREGDRWAVVGPLNFIDMHCNSQRLKIIWIRPQIEVK